MISKLSDALHLFLGKNTAICASGVCKIPANIYIAL